MTDQLDHRALDRALLARQHLLARATMPADALVDHLVGLQAQIPTNPYVALWSRLVDFRAASLATSLTDRRVVRLALMRSTIHLVGARDALALRPLVQTAIERSTLTAYRRRLADAEPAEIATAGRAVVEERPRTLQEIGAALSARWPDAEPDALAYVVRALVPLVQVPPRGVWGAGGLAVHASAEAWLGAPLDAAPSLDALVVRYLAAFGPASVRDAQSWSGLTRLREVFERLRPTLVPFRDANGVELFDLPDAPRPHADTPAPGRFLPDYDNVLLAHADRARIVADADRPRIVVQNGMRPTVLVDGRVRATWRAEREGGHTVVVVSPFGRPTRADRAAILDEGERLASFLADDGASGARMA